MEFRNWTIDEINGAIKTLEEAIATGVASASYPGGGTITYTSQNNMKTALRAMYSVLDARTDGRKRLRRVLFSSPTKGL